MKFKHLNGARAVLAGAVAILTLGAAAPEPDAVRARLERHAEGPVLVLTGLGLESYRLHLAPDGRLEVVLPAGPVSLEPAASDGRLALSSPRQDTVRLAPVAALMGVEVSAGELRLLVRERTAADTAAGAVYRIGVGDKLRLGIYGDEQYSSQEMRVVEDGTVAAPYVGQVQVAGLTASEAADGMSSLLAEGYLVDPKVSVEIIEYQSQWVNVSGQVEKPGRYYLEGPTRLVDIIARAGGLKREAGTEIRVTRAGSAGGDGEALTVDRQDLYLTDDATANPWLQSGDTVSVSSEKFFFIKGEVKSPGRYALDRDTTILRAISIAGGFDQYANQKKVELLRSSNGETERLVINVERIESQKDDDVPILPGDIINVRARFL